MRYFLTVKYFLEGNRKAFFHYKRKTERRTTRSLLNERTGYACSFINFLLDCFPATYCNFIAQTPTCPTNQLAPGPPTPFLVHLVDRSPGNYCILLCPLSCVKVLLWPCPNPLGSLYYSRFDYTACAAFPLSSSFLLESSLLLLSSS